MQNRKSVTVHRLMLAAMLTRPTRARRNWFSSTSFSERAEPFLLQLFFFQYFFLFVLQSRVCALVILLPVVSVIQRRHTLTETLSSLQLIQYHLACLRILKMLKINMFFKVDKAAFLKQREQEKEF